MIYFIVNNNLHYIWAGLIFKEILEVNNKQEFSLIKFLPSALTMSQDDNLYKNIYVSQGLFGSFWQLLNLKLEWRIKNNLKRIAFKKNDILFLFTEYEISNHYLVKRAKQSGSRVYIIDEGIGTYIINNYPHLFKGSSLKQRIIDYAIRYLNGFCDSVRLTGNNTLYFPRLNDKYYDGYILFYNFPLRRNIPKIYLKFPTLKDKITNLNPNSILILGEGLNDFYLTEREYIDSLLSVARAAVQSFKYVYFKFHHSEIKYLDRQEFKRLRKELDNLKVKIIDFDKPIAVENIISKLDYPPKFIVSYICTALFNLFAVGCEPIFAYHLLKRKYADFEVLTDLLESVDYNFIFSYEDIKPDYRSNLKLEKIYPSDMDIKAFYKEQQKIIAKNEV